MPLLCFEVISNNDIIKLPNAIPPQLLVYEGYDFTTYSDVDRQTESSISAGHGVNKVVVELPWLNSFDIVNNFGISGGIPIFVNPTTKMTYRTSSTRTEFRLSKSIPKNFNVKVWKVDRDVSTGVISRELFDKKYFNIMMYFTYRKSDLI